MSFFPLHNHSHYSLRDAINTIPQIIDIVKKYGYSGFTLTEHGTLASVIQAYTLSKEAGLKYFPAIEAYVAPRHRFDKEPHIDRGYYHLCLYAMDLEAYRALCYLVTESNKKECFYYKPRIDRELLREFGSKFNIICSSGCLASELARSILKYERFNYDGEDKSELVNENYKEVIDWYTSIFGDRYYLEVHNHGIPAEAKVAEIIIDYSKQKKIKAIFCTDAHYISKEDQFIHQIMLAIKENKSVDKVGFDGHSHCFLSYDELKKICYDETFLNNTLEIADRCNVELPIGQIHMPKIVDTSGLSDSEKMYSIAFEKLSNMFNHNIPREYLNRFDQEFTLISKMNFSGYFLVVQDFVNWAKKNEIPVGPGRGSVAGSLIAFLLGITKVNPMLHKNLVFERFLNDSRAAKIELKFTKV